MTLGEKLKAARAANALTQEALAEKLTVSRAAVAKWETDKGLPDIDNLKAISQLLGVSLDSLLGEEALAFAVLREPIDLTPYGKGTKKKKKDCLMREKFPTDTVVTLVPEPILTKGEKVVDNLLGFLTEAPFGVPTMLGQMKLTDREFYLVERDGVQYVVTVGNEWMETCRLPQSVDNKRGIKFEWGALRFLNCGPLNK